MVVLYRLQCPVEKTWTDLEENRAKLFLVQSPPHKGDSDNRELRFMGTGLARQISMHFIFICYKTGSTWDKGDFFFFAKVYFYILSSSQNSKQPSESCSTFCSLDSCCFMFCFGCLRVLLSLAKDTDT